MDISTHIRSRAHHHGGMTQLARELGVSRQMLYNLLKPHSNPSLNMMIKLGLKVLSDPPSTAKKSVK